MSSLRASPKIRDRGLPNLSEPDPDGAPVQLGLESLPKTPSLEHSKPPPPEARKGEPLLPESLIP